MKLHGLAPAKHLGLEEPDHDALGDRFSHRFVGLALEAYGREVISRGKLMELTALVGIAPEETESLIDDAGLDDGSGERA